ncbi:MAG: hypothetical protein WBK51_14905 [Polaromonas sp.]
MNKTTQSLLLATMLAASGFAAAQNPAVPATRAEVKSEATTGERKLGTGEPAKSATGTPIQGTTAGTTPAATRAEVKSEAGTAERKAGTGEPIKPNSSGTVQGNTSGTTRAEVKAEAGTEPRKLGTGEVAKSGGTTASTTSAERKRMRDERRAMNKANREAKMKSGSTMTPAPKSDKAP